MTKFLYWSVGQIMMWRISGCHGDVLWLIGFEAAPHQKSTLSLSLFETQNMNARGGSFLFCHVPKTTRWGRSKRFTTGPPLKMVQLQNCIHAMTVAQDSPEGN